MFQPYPNIFRYILIRVAFVLGVVIGLIVLAFSAGCLDSTHGEMSLGTFAETICFHAYDCAPTDRGYALGSGVGPNLSISDPVACVRSVRQGWQWIDDNGARRVLGSKIEPVSGYGSDRCLDALEALPCPLGSDSATDVPALEAMLSACSGYTP